MRTLISIRLIFGIRMNVKLKLLVLGIACGIAFSGKLQAQEFATINSDSTVTVLKVERDELKELEKLELPAVPEHWMLNSNGDRLYLTFPASKTVWEVDTKKWQKSREVKFEFPPYYIGFDAEEKHILFGCRNKQYNGKKSPIAILNLKKFRNPEYMQTGNGQKLIFPAADSKTVLVRQIKDRNVLAVNLDSMKSVADLSMVEKPAKTKLSPDGKYLTVLNNAGKLIYVNRESLKIEKEFALGAEIIDFALSPNGSQVFGVNRQSGFCYIYSRDEGKKVDSIASGKLPVYLDLVGEFIVVQHLLGGEFTIIFDPYNSKSVAKVTVDGKKQPAKYSKVRQNLKWDEASKSILVADPLNSSIHLIETSKGFNVKSYPTKSGSPIGLIKE